MRHVARNWLESVTVYDDWPKSRGSASSLRLLIKLKRMMETDLNDTMGSGVWALNQSQYVDEHEK